MKKSLLILAGACLLSACHTLHGMGEDLKDGAHAVGHGVQKAGEAIENVAH